MSAGETAGTHAETLYAQQYIQTSGSGNTQPVAHQQITSSQYGY